MKEGWEIKKLGAVCEVIAGQSPKGKFYNTEGNGMPFYQGKKEYGKKYIKEPSKWTSKVTKVAVKGDILMSVRAPVGPVNFATKEICIGRGLSAIRPGKTIDREYLYNFLVHHENQIESNTGAVFNSINKKQIENIEFPLPPLTEQKHIVAILDKAFDAIDKAIANTEKNLQNTQELFESYLQQMFKKKGENWEEASLSEVFEINPSKKEAKEILDDDALVSFLPMADLNVLDRDVRAKSNKKLHEVTSSYTYFKEGDVLLAKITPCFENGKLGLVNNLTNSIGFGSSEYYVFRSVGKVVSEYLFHYLSQEKFRTIGARNMGGAVGHKRISKEWLLNYGITYPREIKVQLKVAEELDKLQNRSQDLRQKYISKIQSLEELKKSILKKAFQGELSTEKEIA